MAEAVDFSEEVRRRALAALPAQASVTVQAEAQGGRDEGGAPPPLDEDLGLPPECPVTPLGRLGDTFFFLDALGQLQSYRADKLGRLAILSLFGPRAGLCEAYWPRKSQDKTTGEWIITGFKPELAQMDLMTACSRAGVWSPLEKVRGAGAWAGMDGELIWHLGDEIWVTPREKGGAPRIVAAGLHAGRVYPTAPTLPRPFESVQKPGEGGPALRLLKELRTWNWSRPEIDPILLLGWIGAARLGGALKWRPIAWVTGGAGSGKSTLQDLIQGLFGEGGILKLEDASEASVRQTLRFATLPVALDEAEPEEHDNRRLNAMVKLARIAASGGRIGRGGADHEAEQFVIRSCFLLSSILVPSLLPQDASRMAVLSLRPLGDGAEPPKLTPRQCLELGRRLMRRLRDQWWRAEDTIEAYRRAMREAGHTARGQDVFGTLLGCADLLLHDETPTSDELAGWSDKMAAADMAELDVEMSDERAALVHLLTARVENPKDRMRMSVGEWLRIAANRVDDPPTGVDVAQRVLGEIGMKVDYQSASRPAWVAVGLTHQGLMRLFDGTRWGGRPGATPVYAQAFKRLPGVNSPRGPDGKTKPIYIGGAVMRAVLLPLDICLPPRPKVGVMNGMSSGDSPETWSVTDRQPRDGPPGDAALI